MTRRRDLFEELTEGFDALSDRRAGKRTLENWEQGRAKPNAQVAFLIRMVQRFPDTLRRLAEI